MRTLLPALLVCLLIIPVAVPASLQNTTDLPLASTFEGGERFDPGVYPVIVLTGSYREMGRQYGGLMKAELNEEYAFVIDTLTSAGMTKEEILAISQNITLSYPGRVKEIFAGMSETSGLSFDDVATLYYGPIFLLISGSTPDPVPASCSYLATWGNYTTDGKPVVSRNWDLIDSVMPFTKWYVLVIYRPTDGSNCIATWSPAGVRPETFMNSKGLFIADDNCTRIPSRVYHRILPDDV